MNDDNKEGTFINCQTEICNKLLPRVREVVYENLTSFKNPNAKYPNSPKCLKYQISFLCFQSSRYPICHAPRYQAIIGLETECTSCEQSSQVYNKR